MCYEMKLIGKDKLRSFMKGHARTRSHLQSWEAEVETADWKKPLDVKQRYPKASVVGNQQVIFNICGNDYRLWVTVAYKTGIVMVREIGTHKEYDDWKIS